MSEKSKLYSDILSEARPHMYRAIFLIDSGAIHNVIRLSADGDEQAKERAKMMVDQHAVELWDGLRFIDHYAPLA